MHSMSAPGDSEIDRDQAIAKVWARIRKEGLLRDVPQSVLLDMVLADIEGKGAVQSQNI